MAMSLVAWALMVSWQAGAVGSWAPVTPLGTNAGHMLLLSDATVMVQNGDGADWFRLTPDSTGGYTNGTWTKLASMSFPRNFYSCDLLTNGRVFVAGGEHPDGGPQLTNAEVFNPLDTYPLGHWALTSSAGGVQFKDSESEVLPDGTVLVNPVGKGTNLVHVVMIYDPGLDNWIIGPTNLNSDGEASWVKLPDDSILTIDKGSTASERYIPSLNRWIKDANVPVKIYANLESGAALLLPDRRAFVLGASGHTALYKPTGTTDRGSWVAGPDIPDGHFADDAPAAMMSNGKILCAVGTNNPNGGSLTAMFFYEYDYSTGTIGAFQATSSPTDPKPGSPFDSSSYALFFLDLPDGTVLMSHAGDTNGQLYVYQPDGTPLASGKPTIESVSWNKNGSLHLTGKLFNGISEGSAFGDDEQEASNYPIVRFTGGLGKVHYGRTYDWSSTSVRTGNRIVTTEATLPTDNFDATGTYSLVVIANGIASDPVTFYGPVWVDFNYGGLVQSGTYQNPYQALSNGVSAVSSGGTIAFKAIVQPSISHETMTISKPMTLIAVGGPATIGQK